MSDDECKCQDHDNDIETTSIPSAHQLCEEFAEERFPSDANTKIETTNKKAESDDYKYIGDFSATPPWHSRSMSCDDCRVVWTGCWDNFQCPKCGMGDLPVFGGEPMTLSKLKTMIATE